MKSWTYESGKVFNAACTFVLVAMLPYFKFAISTNSDDVAHPNAVLVYFSFTYIRGEGNFRCVCFLGVCNHSFSQ